MKLSPYVLAAALAIATLPVSAQLSVNIQLPGVVHVEPPPPRFERRPGPRNGQVWVPGHWHWNQRTYVWRAGYWQASRRDFAFAPGEWVRVDDGWRWREGNWRRAERREERREERRHADRHDERHGHGHCPPGQAKKGRC